MKEYLDRSSVRGQTGVGTLIIFIALILVAVLSAMVLVEVVRVLQISALQTGTESSDQVVNRPSIIHENTGEKNATEDIVELENSQTKFTNISYIIRNSTGSINYKGGSNVNAGITSGNSTLLVSSSDDLTVYDSDELLLINRSSGGWEIANQNTSESVVSDNSSFDVTSESGNTQDELSIIDKSGESISVLEDSSDSLEVELIKKTILVNNHETVGSSVSSGGSLLISGASKPHVSGSSGANLSVYDGDELRVQTNSNDDVTLINENTSEWIETSYPIVVRNDSDGNPDETIRFQNYTNNEVQISEDTDGKFYSADDADYELDTSIQISSLVISSGEQLSSSVSSGQSVLLSDGSQELTIHDGDKIKATKSGDNELTLTNSNTSANLVTKNDNLEVIDDTDGTSGETLTLSNESGRTVESTEERVQLIEIYFSTRELNESYEAIELVLMRGAGSDAIDLESTMIHVVGSNEAYDLTYSGNESPVKNAQFGIEPIKDDGGTAPVLTGRGDRFKVVMNIGGLQDEYDISVVSASGGSDRVHIATPL